jgi:hypothetical protein
MMHEMRTTITLDEDSRLLVERAMRERGLSFKDAVNDAIRAGLGTHRPAASPDSTTPRDLGSPRVDLTQALQIAAQLEDDAQSRGLAEGR